MRPRTLRNARYDMYDANAYHDITTHFTKQSNDTTASGRRRYTIPQTPRCARHDADDRGAVYEDTKRRDRAKQLDSGKIRGENQRECCVHRSRSDLSRSLLDIVKLCAN